jgi:adenylyltransferase/sulfurtransferase
MFSAVDSLRQQIASHEATLQDLRQQLAEAEHNQRQQDKALRQRAPLSHDPLDHDMNFGVPDNFRSEVFAVLEQDILENEAGHPPERRWPLDPHEYKRYGRQLIMPEIGLRGLCYCQSATVSS